MPQTMEMAMSLTRAYERRATVVAELAAAAASTHKPATKSSITGQALTPIPVATKPTAGGNHTGGGLKRVFHRILMPE